MHQSAQLKRRRHLRVSDISPVSSGPDDGRALRPYDQARAEAAVRELLIAIGVDPD